MKVKFANRIYEVLFTKELAGLTMYAVQDEPNHIDWLINVEVIDAEKNELKKIEQKSEINDNILLRFSFYQYDDDTLYLSSVFVEECNRKHGYGTKILKAAEEVAKTFGISKIRLKVERNTWMEEWYKKSGYEYLSSEGKYDWLEKRVEQKPDEDNCKISDCVEKVDMTEYNKGFECGKQQVLKYPEDFGLCEKPAWSEEDEQMLHEIIQCVYDNVVNIGTVNKVKYIDWLKSLKERYTWRPSDEQIKALWDSIPENVKEISEREMLLDSLYQDLKKLRKE